MGLITVVTRQLESFTASFKQLSFLLFYYYRSTVKEELKLGEIGQNDRVLCIGGGCTPCTAVEIARSTGAQVKVIDKDPTAVQEGKKMVAFWGMDNKVSVEPGDGCTFDVRDYTFVHIALQVFPRKQIIRNVTDNVDPGTKIIVRMPRKGWRRFYPFNCTDCPSYNGWNKNVVASAMLFIKPYHS